MTRKRISLLVGFLALAACTAPIIYNGIDFGNDSGQWVHDGECDDPRFVGGGMAYDLDTNDIKRDASDCLRLYQAQRIRPVRLQSQWSTAQCRQVSFGNNASPYARDGECDDPRFTGPGTDSLLLGDDRMRDAADCRALCNAGAVWIR